MGSASSLGGSITSAASDALTTVAEPNASKSPSADHPDASGRRFADASGRRFERESKSYAGRVSAYKAAAAAYTDVTLSLEALAHVNRVAGTDFDLDDYRHVSKWCPTRPSPIIAPVEAVHIVTAARAEADQPREELQPRRAVKRLFSPKAKRLEETPAAGGGEPNEMQAFMLLRDILRVTELANAAMVKFQDTEAARLCEKYGRKLVPSSLMELLRGPRSPQDWDEIDDLLVGALPSRDVAERRLCALALSLRTLPEIQLLPV
jgi:hypothetical protein